MKAIGKELIKIGFSEDLAREIDNSPQYEGYDSNVDTVSYYEYVKDVNTSTIIEASDIQSSSNDYVLDNYDPL